MNKIIKSLKKDGLLKTCKKIINVIKHKSFEFLKIFRKNIITKEIDVYNFKTIIIFENNFCWDKIMKQRPQQIAENLPADTLMFYHSHTDSDFQGKRRIRKIKENLILIDLGYYRNILFDELAAHNNKFLMIYSTDYIPYKRIGHYQKYRYKVLYECVDDIDEKLSGKDLYNKFIERHKKIINDKKIYIVCTADRLLNNIKKERKNNLKLITNGVNYEFFKYKEYKTPSDLISIKNKYKKIIGYYGALASWFDYDLIKKLSKNKEYAIVLLGIDYDQTVEESGILEIENIFYLGQKPYKDLPSYGCNFDIFMIPFLINDITLSTSPVKIFEYMAMEKPIVTTALPECKKYKSVLFSNDHKEFINNVHKAINLTGNKKYLNTLKKESAENDWKTKAKTMVDFINGEDKNVKYNF